MLLVLIGAGIISLLLYLYWAASLTHWKKLKVPHIPPHFLWGNLKDVIYQKKTFFQVYQRIYSKFPNAPYVGLYIMNRPGLLIRDPQLIKQMVQTDFESFRDNDILADEYIDPIFAKNPFVSKGEIWKERRAIHSAQFSPGKMKNIFTLCAQGGDRMIEFLNNEISKNGTCTVEAMELAFKYTIYNIGNYALGVDSKTFDEDNPELRDMARKLVEPNLYEGMKQTLIFLLPSLSRYLTVRFISAEVTERFRKLVKGELEYRMQNSIIRNDYFENIQVRKGEKVSVDDMVVQIGGLFLDGAATNSTAISFMLYELAVNLDIQRRLAEEVDEFLSDHEGRTPYEEFEEMPYLTAVISEALRKYPPAPILKKTCTEPYTFSPINDGGESFSLQPGMPVVLPLILLHSDEKYFPEPDKFDPTRFLGENKDKIADFTYMPFSKGLRMCIGMRFGLLQSKMMLLKLVSEFELRLNPKTKIPLEYNPQSNFLLAAKGGVWINIYKRKNKVVP